MRTRSHIKPFTALILSAFLAAACMPLTASQNAAPQPTSTATSVPTATVVPTATEDPIPDGYVEYFTQSGDTLPVVAAHFGVSADAVIAEEQLDDTRILNAGTRLLAPDVLDETTPAEILFPDALLVYSPEVIGFDVQAFAEAQGGYLSTSTELMTRGTTLASEVIFQLAQEFSVNPRILLAVMEENSGWVSGQPQTEEQKKYPYGYVRGNWEGIYRQVGWAIRFLMDGYYGWREGTLTELTFTDGEVLRLNPYLNAGTVAVLNLYAQTLTRAEWENRVYDEASGISAVYGQLFGDPWERVDGFEPLFPEDIEQPQMNLPFPINQKWNLTSGPHPAWGRYGPRASLDFAPPTAKAGCGTSVHWTTAVTAGRVVRTGNGVVVLDLDGDGYEQTGWVVLYMHVGSSESVALDTFVQADDQIGHPSCDGGSSSGIHIHIARKYNGEWVLADGGLPFTMSGYTTAAAEPVCDYAWWGWCEGTLDDGIHRVVEADPFGNYLTTIFRPDSDMEFLLQLTPTPKP